MARVLDSPNYIMPTPQPPTRDNDGRWKSELWKQLRAKRLNTNDAYHYVGEGCGLPIMWCNCSPICRRKKAPGLSPALITGRYDIPKYSPKPPPGYSKKTIPVTNTKRNKFLTVPEAVTPAPPERRPILILDRPAQVIPIEYDDYDEPPPTPGTNGEPVDPIDMSSKPKRHISLTDD